MPAQRHSGRCRHDAALRLAKVMLFEKSGGESLPRGMWCERNPQNSERSNCRYSVARNNFGLGTHSDWVLGVVNMAINATGLNLVRLLQHYCRAVAGNGGYTQLLNFRSCP